MLDSERLSLYNLNMFFGALQPFVAAIIIAVIAVQYAFALFCLLKLAYLDISKKEYVLWNLFILIVFFVGGIAFLVYYYKVKDEKRVVPTVDTATEPEQENAERLTPEQIEKAANADTEE